MRSIFTVGGSCIKVIKKCCYRKQGMQWMSSDLHSNITSGLKGREIWGDLSQHDSLTSSGHSSAWMQFCGVCVCVVYVYIYVYVVWVCIYMLIIYVNSGMGVCTYTQGLLFELGVFSLERRRLRGNLTAFTTTWQEVVERRESASSPR